MQRRTLIEMLWRSDLVAQFGFLVIVGGYVLLMLRILQASPDWAAWPIMLLTPAALLFVALWVRRRSRIRVDGAAMLAEAERPLAEQAKADYFKRYASPDRGFVAVLAPNELGRDGWVEELWVVDVAKNRKILDLPHPYLVSDLVWDPDNRLRFTADCSPGGARNVVDVVLEPHTRMAHLRAGGEEAAVPFRQVASWLGRYYERQGLALRP